MNFRKIENSMPPKQMARATRRLKDAQVNASKSVGILISFGEAIIDGTHDYYKSSHLWPLTKVMKLLGLDQAMGGSI